ncbi:uncharacterized protein [Choristoneura fumiferana]|uniref:uncharacterized protein n=1 Tax=Choristoneura fumiferana TaxID=7141 RepID=UPI003D155F76
MNVIIIFSIASCMNASIASAMLAAEEYNQENVKCAETIIKQIECKSLTLVNFDDDLQLAKNLHNLMKYQVIQRHSFGPKMNMPNEAYAIMCKNTEDCDGGLGNLTKDRYWNPNSTFLIIMKKTPNYEKLFKKLHRSYAFKTVILSMGHLYLYNFNIASHCEFTPRAILKYPCKRLYDSNSAIHIIRQSLKEWNKIPYSGCRLRLRINVIKPYIFPPVSYSDAPVGFEEEYVKVILKKIPNATYEYDTEKNIIGYVSRNFTTTNTLKDIHDNLIQGVLGATILSNNRLSVFDFTSPHIHHDLVLTVPKAVKVEKWKVMTTLIKPVIWALILVTSTSILLLAFALKKYDSKYLQILNVTSFDVSKYLMSIASKRTASFLILLWILFTSYMEVFYQSFLASIFTKPVLYKQVNSLDELLQKKYKFFLYKHLKTYEHDTHELDMSGLVNADTEICENHLECLSLVAKGGKKYALLTRLTVEYYEPKYRRKNGEAKLFVIQEPYQHLLMTTYLKKGNPNLKRTQFLERQLIASGLPLRTMKMLIHKNKLKYSKFQSEPTEILTCGDIAGLYFLLLTGYILAIVFFLCEVLTYRQQHRIHSHNRDL